MLNPQSPLPLYRQLADLLLSRVRSGEYAPGARIPAEHVLAATHSIGRPTVRQAIELLVRKRVLVRRRGSGTYVSHDPHEVDLFSLAGTLSAFQRTGLEVSSELLEKTAIVQVEPDPENPFAGKQAYFFSRLSRVREMPVLLEDIYLYPEHFPRLDALNLEGRSLSRIVDEHYFLRPTGGRQNFRIGSVSGNRARALDVTPSTPILVVKRFLHFPSFENGIYSELFCLTYQFVFSQTIGGMTHD